MVKAEDALSTEKKKAAEAVAADLESEFSEVNAACDTAVEQMASLSQAELANVR